jgi:hypothetical protein
MFKGNKYDSVSWIQGGRKEDLKRLKGFQDWPDWQPEFKAIIMGAGVLWILQFYKKEISVIVTLIEIDNEPKHHRKDWTTLLTDQVARFAGEYGDEDESATGMGVDTTVHAIDGDLWEGEIHTRILNIIGSRTRERRLEGRAQGDAERDAWELLLSTAGPAN